MDFISIKVTGETRCCTTCLDENAQVMTELIEPSFPASADDVRAFLDSCDRELSGAAGIAFCGSLPDGTDPGMYVKAAELAAKHHALLLIDAFRDLEEVFAAAEKVLLKINKEELEKLSGEKGIEKGLKKLFSTFSSIKYAAITDGPGTAFASDGKLLATFSLPELPFVASPLGCGDTASAILLAELCSGKDLFTAFQNALAAASANCLNPTPGKFRIEDAEKLLPVCSVREF
jgi:tagatose 6-phosphate kinase